MLYIAMTYVVLFVGAGIVIGSVFKGNWLASGIGLTVSGLLGFSFGLPYALLSLIEFGVGLKIASFFGSSKKSKDLKP